MDNGCGKAALYSSLAYRRARENTPAIGTMRFRGGRNIIEGEAVMREQQSHEDQGADEFLLQKYEHFLSSKAEGTIDAYRGPTPPARPTYLDQKVSW